MRVRTRAYTVYVFLNIPAAQAKNITTVCTVPVCIPFEIPHGSVGRLEYLGDRYTKTRVRDMVKVAKEVRKRLKIREKILENG